MKPRTDSSAPDTDSPTAANNIISLLEERAVSHPTRTALWSPHPAGSAQPHGSMSYAELSAAAEAVAAGLSERGVSKGDRVFLFVPMVAELYVTLFGVLRLGAVAIFLDSWARRDQLSECAKQVEPRGFVGPEPAHGMIEGVPGFEDVGVAMRVGPGTSGTIALEDVVAARGRRPIEPVLPSDSALVTFTTGSSGVPKGADRTHGFLAAQHAALDASIRYEAQDVDLPVFPVFSLNNLAAGVTTVLPNVDLASPAPDDGIRLLGQMRELGVTCSTLSPSLLRGVTAAAEGADALPPLRRVVTGGAPVGRHDVDEFARAFPRAELHILYGSTEVEPIAHLRAEEMPAAGRSGVCLGDPSPALALRFIRPTRDAVELNEGDWSSWAVDPGEGGELLVAGPHVCPGYFRNPGAFARAKVVGPGGQVWHRTGDVCTQDEQGRLWMLGRVHNAIRRDGRLLFPVEAEMVMNRLPFVDRAAYVGVPDPDLGEAAWAVFTAHDADDPIAIEAVRAALEEARVTVDRVVIASEIPMDPRHHSKVDVDALRAILLSSGPPGP